MAGHVIRGRQHLALCRLLLSPGALLLSFVLLFVCFRAVMEPRNSTTPGLRSTTEQPPQSWMLSCVHPGSRRPSLDLRLQSHLGPSGVQHLVPGAGSSCPGHSAPCHPDKGCDQVQGQGAAETSDPTRKYRCAGHLSPWKSHLFCTHVARKSCACRVKMWVSRSPESLLSLPRPLDAQLGGGLPASDRGVG